MDKYVKHIELKQISIGAVLLLSLVGLGLTAGLVWNAYRNNASAQRLSEMNDISDAIIVAAGFEAIERGVTATALSAEGPASPDLIEKINTLRAKGDEAAVKALKMAADVAARESDNVDYTTLLNKANEARKAHLDAREKVDASLLKTERDIRPADWIKIVTSFIDSGARLRQAGFTTTDPLPKITQDNILTKQAVWLASEYAGLERANVGTMVAAQKPIPADLLKKLNSFRAIVELNMKEITTLRDSKATDPRILTAIKDMEASFMNRFEETRKQVYGAAETGQYTISAKEWIERSTEGIDSILAISSAITKVSEENAKNIADKNKLILAWFVLQTIAGLLISTIIIITVQKKVGKLWNLHESMNQLSTGQGDLTFRLHADSKDEVGKAAEAFNRFMDQLQNIIKQVQQAAAQVSTASAQLSATSASLGIGAGSQVEQAGQAASSMDEMKTTVTDVAKNASEAANFSRMAADMAQKGGNVINETVKGMQNIAQSVEGAATVIDSLGKSSDQIGEIVSLINEIADQTNLLALNAAIEAARAGEQGRGFAVVADEVRKLAERTAKATAEIARMIKTIQGDTKKAVVSMKQGTTEVESGVALANQAGESLMQIVDGSQKLSDMISQIATAAEEQSAVSAHVSETVESISHIAKENNLAVNQIATASDDLLSLSVQLQRMVGQFKV